MPHTVLLVDDEPKVLTNLQRGLRKESYEILCATSADAALDILRVRAVDVVISDQDMPGLTGTAFLAQVRKEFPETMRYILTGKATADVVLQAINESAISGFFTKPTRYVDLAETLRLTLQQKDIVKKAIRLLHTVEYQSAEVGWLRQPPTYVQIDSPRRIMAALLQPFLIQSKEVFLVEVQRKHIMSATLQSIQETNLVIDAQFSTLLRKHREQVVVVFPVLPQQHYALPTCIDQIYFNRLKLRFQDAHDDEE